MQYNIFADNDTNFEDGLPLVSLGFNLADGDPRTLDHPDDIVDTDPLLTPLSESGGYAPTHRPSASSPAMGLSTERIRDP